MKIGGTELKTKYGSLKGTALHEKDGVPFFTFKALDEAPWAVNAFSTRLGGVSRDECESMNFAFIRDKHPEAVRENYRRFAAAAGFDERLCVASYQTHTVNVRRVYESDAGTGIFKDERFSDTDGLITDVPGLVLVTFYADCVPLYFIDTAHRAVGLSHAGWRGTAAGMAKVTLEEMRKAFGTRPEDVKAAIGPSICQDCFEVGEEVARAFPDECVRLMENAEGAVKPHVDLWRANELAMLSAGIPKENITLPEICTCCNPKILFSHRASKGRRGNLAAFLGIRK